MSYDNYDPEFFEFAQKSVKKSFFPNIDLKQVREDLGINQKEMSGMSQPDVSKIENRKDMKISTLIKYADAMGLKVKISFVEKETENSINILN